MFNLEKLVKTPINTGHRHIETNGACCAFGLAFVASTPNQVDYSPSPSGCAMSSREPNHYKALKLCLQMLQESGHEVVLPFPVFNGELVNA